MGGMIAATVIGVFMVPLLFVTVRRIFKGKVEDHDKAEAPATHP
jgi:multidrug efflux pump